MSKAFPRHCKSNNSIAVSGSGVYITDNSGKQYLDPPVGPVSCLGHSDPEIIRAIESQLANLEFAHTGFFTSQAAEDLAELLISHAPGSLERSGRV